MFTVVTKINLELPQPEYDPILINLNSVMHFRKVESMNIIKFVDGSQLTIVENLSDLFKSLDKANLIVAQEKKKS